MEIIKETRAKKGYIEVQRQSKYGQNKPTNVKQHIVVSEGMLSSKEMERVMRDVAADAGVSEDQIRIETYQHGEAPIEANPRHRGTSGIRGRSRPDSEAREVRDTRRESRPRKYWFGGI